jgi:hypothetical protein
VPDPVFAAPAWTERFRHKLRSDRELAHVIRWSAFALAWRSESAELVIVVRARTAATGPAGDLPTVAVRAPAARWARLLRPVPPPWHTDLLGMARRYGDVTLEPAGSTLVRNLRAINRIVELSRAAH